MRMALNRRTVLVEVERHHFEGSSSTRIMDPFSVQKSAVSYTIFVNGRAVNGCCESNTWDIMRLVPYCGICSSAGDSRTPAVAQNIAWLSFTPSSSGTLDIRFTNQPQTIRTTISEFQAF